MSFIVPIKLEAFHSKRSGQLDVSLQSGKKVLNGKNSNYSYGMLQQVFEFSFKKEDLKREDLTQVLILGFGGGSVADVLREQIKFTGLIRAVEIDKMMIEITRKHFPHALENVDLVIDDALEFVKEDRELYDLIIVDLFIDDRVLVESYSPGFLKAMKKSLAPGGKIIHNLMLKHKEMNKALDNYKEVFPEVRHSMIFGTNLVIVAEG